MAKGSDPYSGALSTTDTCGPATLTSVVWLKEGATQLQSMRAPKETAKHHVNIGNDFVSSKVNSQWYILCAKSNTLTTSTWNKTCLF